MKLLAILAVVAAIASTLEAKSINPLVIGGTEADRNEFPFLVGIWIVEGGATKELKCTGLIVDKKVVVTSAKCIDKDDGTPYDAADIEVIAGDHDISADDNDGEVKETVAKINIKDERKPDLNENDIVALILTNGLDLTDEVAVATLPAAADEIEDGQVGTVAGWGEKDGEEPVNPPPDAKLKPSEAATILQKAQVTKVAKAACEAKFTSVSDESFCAGSPDGTVAICKGDLGSPLVVEADGTKTVVGFVNQIETENCEKDAAGALFTKLATHVAWIQEQIPEDPTDPDPSTEPSSEPSSDATSQTSEPTNQTSQPTGQTSDATGQTSDATGQTSDATGQTHEPTGQTSEPTNPSEQPTSTPASGIMVKNNFWLLILAIPLLVFQH